MGFEGILEMWQLHEKFQSGEYQQVVDLFHSPKNQRGNKPPKQLASVVGALSFLGKMEEAEILFSLQAKTCPQTDEMACRFFLAIGWVRRSDYKKAEALLQQNIQQKSKLPIEKFFQHQGNAFFLFYTGRLGESAEEASIARKSAIEAKDPWARCLATDALGHVQVRGGAIQAGLSYLEEAKNLAQNIGNKSSASAIQISLQCYRWEYGWSHENLVDLEKVLQEQKPENSYSQASLLLEIARQFTLRGNFSQAREVLEQAAQKVYASKNRRQEVILHLRMSELAFRQGDFFQSKHYLWFCQRLLHEEVDQFLQLPALGIQRKIALAEGNLAEVERIDRHWLEQTAFTSIRDLNLKVRLGLENSSVANPEDRIHEKLFAASKMTEKESQLRALLEVGFYGEVAAMLALRPGQKTVAILPANLGIFVQSAIGMEWNTITALQRKILQLLQGGCSKEELLLGAWGYTYDPLRHDSMLYAAISGLRKSLGLAGAWVRPTENGYCLEATLWTQERLNKPKILTPAEPKITALSSPLRTRFALNHRQLEILDWLKSERYLSVKEVRQRFRVAEITALRDLDGLRKTGVVLRVGRARATRYALAEEKNR
jgi:hypothetical protein